MSLSGQPQTTPGTSYEIVKERADSAEVFAATLRVRPLRGETNGRCGDYRGAKSGLMCMAPAHILSSGIPGYRNISRRVSFATIIE